MDITLIRRQRRPKPKSGGLLALRFVIGALAVVLLTFVGVAAVGAAVLFGVYAYYTQSLPTAEEISQASVDTTRPLASMTEPARCSCTR
jgi:hypothetical protein